MPVVAVRTILLGAVLLLPLAACGSGGGGDGVPDPSGGGAIQPLPLSPHVPIADTRGLRSFDGGATVLVLSFSSVMPGTEDRTIVHFDVRGLSGTIPKAYCHVPVRNLDPGGAPGTFEVARWAGDGVVSPDEWGAGTLTDTFSGIASVSYTFTVSVQSWLQHCVDNGFPYFSIELSGGSGTDRYDLGSSAGLPDPWIELQP